MTETKQKVGSQAVVKVCNAHSVLSGVQTTPFPQIDLNQKQVRIL